MGAWRAGIVGAPGRRMDADAPSREQRRQGGVARDRRVRARGRGAAAASRRRRDRRVGRRRGADACRLGEAGDPAPGGGTVGTVPRSTAGHPRPRTGARAPARLPLQPGAVDRRDAALLSPRRVVGLGTGATEREHCCDDLAIAVCGDRLVYVSAPGQLTTINNRHSLALAATDGSLLARVQRILGRPRSMREPAPAWALLALFMLIGSSGSFQTLTPEPAAAATEDALANVQRVASTSGLPE